jgi:hypothetical protein
MLETNNTIL